MLSATFAGDYPDAVQSLTDLTGLHAQCDAKGPRWRARMYTHMNAHFRSAGTGLLTGIALTLASCVSCTGGSIPCLSGEAHPDTAYTGSVPEFVGPWAEEFRTAYLKTTSDEARGYLADQVISDLENRQLLRSSIAARAVRE